MATDTDPYISVICPVYNDPEGVVETITSLRDQTYPEKRYEIIVVDNGSDDETRSLATKALTDVDNGFVIDETDIQSSYAARNTGIEHSNGEILAFIDADMTASSEWLAQLLTAFDKTSADYIGCDVELTIPDGTKTLIGQYNRATAFPIESYLKHQHFVPTCALAVRRNVFADIGLFNDRLQSGGDLEFGQRVAAAGYSQVFAPNAVLYHPARTTLTEFVSKALRVGRGKEQIYRSNPEGPIARFTMYAKNLLPPNPIRFYNYVSKSNSIPTLVLFYTMTYIFDLLKFVGRFSG
ncbi:glycosyltransferase family 2 protein [Halostagnicola bangensis]